MHTVGRNHLNVNTHQRQTKIHYWLDKVDKAYGTPATVFRNRMLEAWKKVGQRWPRKGSDPSQALDNIFQALYHSLKDLKSNAEEQAWTATELKSRMDAELVCCASFSSACRLSRPQTTLAQDTAGVKLEKIFHEICNKTHWKKQKQRQKRQSSTLSGDCVLK